MHVSESGQLAIGQQSLVKSRYLSARRFLHPYTGEGRSTAVRMEREPRLQSD